MVAIEGDKPQEVTVRRLGKDGTDLAIFEFQGRLREAMIASLREGHLATGNFRPTAKAVSPQGAMSLTLGAAAAGATAASAAFSSTLFMATANPATLMALGNGVGSAVMGAGGILGHAPFIAVASSLPVVAPILAIQALNSAMMMQQFKQVDQKLDTIKRTLDTAIARIEATYAGELLAASRIVDEVYAQYKIEGSFSTDMLVRLGLAERDAKALSARFRQLVEARTATNFKDLEDVQQANYDAHSAMLASFVELRVSYLRVCVDMQENPKSVTSSIERLKSTMDDGIAFWQHLQDRSRVLKDDVHELEEKLQELNWAERRRPGRSGGPALERQIAKRTAAYTSTMESEREIMSDFHELMKSAREARRELDAPKVTGDGVSPTLVYWKDEAGEHSFITEENLLS